MIVAEEMPELATWFAYVYDRTIWAFATAANIALATLVVVVLAAVAVRYSGIFPGLLHWTTELSRFTVIWIVMLGSVVALDRGAHLAMDFTGSLPARSRRLVRATGYILGVAFLAILAWQGLKLSQATMRQISPALGLPMGWAYLAIPVGAAIMTLQSVLFAVMPTLASRGDKTQSGRVSDTTL